MRLACDIYIDHQDQILGNWCNELKVPQSLMSIENICYQFQINNNIIPKLMTKVFLSRILFEENFASNKKMQ